MCPIGQGVGEEGVWERRWRTTLAGAGAGRGVVVECQLGQSETTTRAQDQKREQEMQGNEKWCQKDQDDKGGGQVQQSRKRNENRTAGCRGDLRHVPD